MPAARFHDGLSGATHTARIAIDGALLRVAGQDNVLLAAWPLAAVKAAPEIDPDGAVTLTARGLPGVLLIDGAEDLDMLRRAGLRLPRHRSWTARHWSFLVLAMAALLGLGALGLDALPRWLAAIIPASWESELGAPAEAIMTASSKRCTGKDGRAALDRLAARLREAGHIETPITVTVLDDKLVNAFTLPGGRVLVMRGLIDTAADGAELAGVIAPEFGHVAHHDSTTLLLRSLGISILLHAVGLGDTAGTAAQTAGDLLNLAYGRAAESAADDTAIALLSAAGLRADGLSRFFDHMEARAEKDQAPAAGEAGQGSGIKPPRLTWLSTHPPSLERRERTARAMEGALPFTGREWQAIKTMCPRK